MTTDDGVTGIARQVDQTVASPAALVVSRQLASWTRTGSSWSSPAPEARCDGRRRSRPAGLMITIRAFRGKSLRTSPAPCASHQAGPLERCGRREFRSSRRAPLCHRRTRAYPGRVGRTPGLALACFGSSFAAARTYGRDDPQDRRGVENSGRPSCSSLQDRASRLSRTFAGSALGDASTDRRTAARNWIPRGHTAVL
jgi:hypothetical protein